jgi:hypothetical protein
MLLAAVLAPDQRAALVEPAVMSACACAEPLQCISFNAAPGAEMQRQVRRRVGN